MKKIIGLLLLVSSLVQAKEDKILLLPVFSLGEVKKPKATVEMTEAIQEALKNNALPIVMVNDKNETFKKIQKTVMANEYTHDLQTQLVQAAKQQHARYVLVLAMTYNAPLYRVGGYFADTEQSLVTSLNEISPDVELLSASVEAHALAKNVQSKYTQFTPPFITNNQEFLPNVAVKPIATQTLITPVKKAPVEMASLQTVKPVRPAEGGVVGGVVSSAVPIKSSAHNSKNFLAQTEPLPAVSATKNDSVFKKWWFWTAVGVGAGLLGVGTYLVMDHVQQNNDATISATWR